MPATLRTIVACRHRAGQGTGGTRKKSKFQPPGHLFSFDEKVKETKRKIMTFLIDAKRAGKSIAERRPRERQHAAQLLRHPHPFSGLHGGSQSLQARKISSGTHIPIFAPEKIRETKPDYVLILPWNLKNEIQEQLFYIREWGGKFVVPIPEVEVF